MMGTEKYDEGCIVLENKPAFPYSGKAAQKASEP